jgi:hypothetical protein
MQSIDRRSALIASSLIPGCLSRNIANAAETKHPPKNLTSDAEIVIHNAFGYPKRWKQVYEQAIKHYASTCGKVGPNHRFLVEDPDGDSEKLSDVRRKELLKSKRNVSVSSQNSGVTTPTVAT